MEGREDLKSILPFLPLVLRSSSLCWPPKALEALKAVALGPDVSRIHSGEVLVDAILDLRDALSLSSRALASGTADGYALFFDDLMPRVESRMWFGEIVPYLARLLLRLPSLLEEHYLKSDEVFGEGKAGLRILGPQEAGIVFLSQELIAALLACAVLCLFPTKSRSSSHLPIINFDQLFAILHSSGAQRQEEKIKCIVHYFERLCLSMPTGYVSFERKVLLGNFSSDIAYPDAASWEESASALCSFQVSASGFIEDQPHEALEVDFANKYLGGGALSRGCVQEEIRFMINPELIAGMLFMPSMEDNEAIEIVGVERFSSYTGYGSSFQFVGDYLDNKPFDSIGRRKTSIIAIDAFSNPGMRQYKVGCLVREINKAFSGFLVSRKHHCYSKTDETSSETVMSSKNSEIGTTSNPSPIMNSYSKISQVSISREKVGIATGNWGCGAFGGDPEIKSMIQWLAASQASRPLIHYYTFGESSLDRLEEVARWILQHGWTVGDLWSMLLQYCAQRLDRETEVGFLTWLLPCRDFERSNDDDCMSE